MALLWAAPVLLGLGLLVADDGPGYDQLQQAREIVGACCIGLGTLLAFVKQLDNGPSKIADSDLETFAIAFLAVGALLPLVRSFAAAGTGGEVGLGVLVALTFISAGLWSWRAS